MKVFIIAIFTNRVVYSPSHQCCKRIIKSIKHPISIYHLHPRCPFPYLNPTTYSRIIVSKVNKILFCMFLHSTYHSTRTRNTVSRNALGTENRLSIRLTSFNEHLPRCMFHCQIPPTPCSENNTNSLLWSH